MQRSLATTDSSGGTAARRGKYLPPIQTQFTQDASTQTLQVCQVEASPRVSSSSLRVESLPDDKRQSKKLLGIFDRSKSQKDNSSSRDSLNSFKIAGDQNTTQTEIKKTSHLQKKRPQNKDGPVKPPTFVQALARAAKRITLAVPVTNANDLLQIRKHQQQSSIVEEEETGENNTSDLRGAAPAFLPTNWMACIFILTTGGLLLQYSAIGLSDRLPQRFIQLTGDSTAFASDAVAGRSWVVQVIQSANNNSGSGGARSRLSRIGNRSNKAGKASILLVMETAKQMDSWLLALKSAIFEQGNKERQDEILSQKPSSERTRTRASSNQSSSSKISTVTNQSHLSTTSREKKELTTASNLSVNRHEFLQKVDNESKSTASTSPIEETKGLLRESIEQNQSSELSPPQKTLVGPLLQWDLPANFSPTFSSSSSISGFLMNAYDRDIPQDYHSTMQYSPSIYSDVPPNFSVPSFSRRFSQSTKSTTIVVTPSRSSKSSLDTSSVTSIDRDTKEIHSAVSLPLLVTSRKALHRSIVCCAVFDQDWPESEESMLVSLEEEIVLSRPSSSLLFSRGIEAIAMGVKPSKAITPQPSFSLNVEQPSPRENPLGVTCIDGVIHPALRNLDPQKVEEIFPLPPRRRKASMPQVPVTPMNSPQKKSRPHSLHLPSSETQLQKKTSAGTLPPMKSTRPMTLRERKSLAAIPRHLLGPPSAPPPTDPLPAIPTLPTIVVNS